MDEFFFHLSKQIATIGPIGVFVVIMFTIWLRLGNGKHKENVERLTEIRSHEELMSQTMHDLLEQVRRIADHVDEIVTVYKRRR